ncbi:MAG: undecaprenyl-diphosphate phosphatase [Bacteroidia bacterium]|nr:undecaprenyl-diphosphate phosphatase [Bacteroidia bacterium]MDW8133492.1 undecaprenyl-diphosphate phosphatase [Bacteroidia bacterium]
MTLWEAILLAILEGITEFLPVSSTGHMILMSSALGRADETFVKDFEIIIQGGAILAVVAHSWSRLWKPWLYVQLGAAFLPTAFIGFLAKDFVENLLGSPHVVAINLVVGGFILIYMDKWFKRKGGSIENLSLYQAFLIGIIQSLSLLPGISRAAAALFGAQLMGLHKRDAAEFSFLLAIPTLGAASAYRLWKSPVALTSENFPILFLGVLVAFIVALGAMRFLVFSWHRYGLAPFGVYRIVLGILVLGWLVIF